MLTPQPVEIKNLSLGYHERSPRVVDGFSYTFQAGRIYSLIAPSGAGKTTLLLALSNAASKHEVLWISDVPTQWSEFPRPIGYAFQRPIFLPWLSISENMRVFSKINNVAFNETMAQELLTELEIPHVWNVRPRELSGGMQSRAALATIMSITPATFFLDEAFAGLDEEIRNIALSAIRRRVVTHPAFCLNVTHNWMEALMFSDEIIVLSACPLRVVGSLIINKTSNPHVNLASYHESVCKIDELRNLCRAAETF